MSRHLISCHECDELCTLPSVLRPGRYKCPNCGHTLFRHSPGMIEKLYAIHIAALILFLLSNWFPFLTFEVLGNSSEANFTTAVQYLYQEQDYLLAVALLMTTIIVPSIRIVLILLLVAPLHHGRIPRFAPYYLKTIEEITPWGMLDVFLVGVLVSIVKLVKMGSIIPGTSLWAFAALILVLAYGQTIFDPHPLWERIEKAQKEGEAERFAKARG